VPGTLDDEPHSRPESKSDTSLDIGRVRCIHHISWQEGRKAWRPRIWQAGIVIVIGGERIVGMKGRVAPLRGELGACSGAILCTADLTHQTWRDRRKEATRHTGVEGLPVLGRWPSRRAWDGLTVLLRDCLEESWKQERQAAAKENETARHGLAHVDNQDLLWPKFHDETEEEQSAVSTATVEHKYTISSDHISTTAETAA
jgi:hypothetical protein